MPQNPNIPATAARRLIPAKEPENEAKANREGADTYVFPGEEGTGHATEGSAAALNPTIGIWTTRYRLWETEFLREIWPLAQYYWSLYRNQKEHVLTTPSQDWRDDTLIPTVFKIIETLTPRQVLMEWAGPEVFTVEGVDAVDEDYERTVKRLIEVMLDKIGQKSHEGNFLARKIEGKRYTNIIGHSWTKFWWRDEVHKRTVKLPKPDGGYEWAEMIDMHYRGLDYTWLPITALAVDLSGAYRWHIEIIKTSLEALERENESYKLQTGRDLYPELPSLRAARIAQSVTQSKSGHDEPEDTEHFPMTVPSDPLETPVELWLCWDNVNKTLTKIADRSVVLDTGLAPTPDGLAPYIPQRALCVPNRVYGESIIKYIGPLAVYQTRIARARADEVMLNIWQQFLFRKDAVVSDEWLQRPGGFIEVEAEPGESLDKVFKRFERRPVFQEAYSEEGYRQRQAEDVAGADAVNQGAEATSKSRDVSATEIKQRVLQGSARWQLGNLESEVVTKKRELERAFNLIRQNLTHPEIVRTIGDDGNVQATQIDLTALQLAVDIKVGSGIHEQALEQKKKALIELMQMLGNPALGQFINPQALLELWFEAHDIKNPKRFIKTKETARADLLSDQTVAAAGQALGSGQGGPPLPAGPGSMAPPGGPSEPTAGAALPSPTGGSVGPSGPSGSGGVNPPRSPAASGPLVEEV